VPPTAAMIIATLNIFGELHFSFPSCLLVIPRPHGTDILPWRSFLVEGIPARRLTRGSGYDLEIAFKRVSAKVQPLKLF